MNSAAAIDPVHLLRGLMWPDQSRAEILFHLRQKFPQYRNPERLTLITLTSKDLPLTLEARKILARSAMEADAMGDAWVDTDHLLLGILCEPDCSAAQQLIEAGIILENVRTAVLQNRSSRPDYGPVIPLGQVPSPKVWLTSKWRWWRARQHEKRFAEQRRRRQE